MLFTTRLAENQVCILDCSAVRRIWRYIGGNIEHQCRGVLELGGTYHSVYVSSFRRKFNCSNDARAQPQYIS